MTGANSSSVAAVDPPRRPRRLPDPDVLENSASSVTATGGWPRGVPVRLPRARPPPCDGFGHTREIEAATRRRSWGAQGPPRLRGRLSHFHGRGALRGRGEDTWARCTIGRRTNGPLRTYGGQRVWGGAGGGRARRSPSPQLGARNRHAIEVAASRTSAGSPGDRAGRRPPERHAQLLALMSSERRVEESTARLERLYVTVPKATSCGRGHGRLGSRARRRTVSGGPEGLGRTASALSPTSSSRPRGVT